MGKRYFWSEKNISEAFDEYSVYYIEGTVGDRFWRKNERFYRYDKNNPPTSGVIPCSNPRCKRGGLQINDILGIMSKKENGEYSSTISCMGDEGSEQGRRIGKSCTYDFRIKIFWDRQ